MKKYSMFHAPFMSFYSADFYRDVGLNWSGTCFGFLFLLLLFCMVPQAARLQFALSGFAEHEAPEFINQVPELKINNGEVTSSAVQPYIIRAPGTGAPLAIIDTTGATASLEGSEAFLLVKRTEVVIKRDSLDTRIVSLKEIRDLTVNQAGLTYLVGLVRSYGVLVFALFALAGAFIFRAAQALLYAALGAGLASLLGVRLAYTALLRLSVIAVTPVILVTTAADTAGFAIPHPWLLAFGAAMGFLFLGIRSASADQSPAATAQESRPPAGQDA